MYSLNQDFKQNKLVCTIVGKEETDYKSALSTVEAGTLEESIESYADKFKHD